MFFVIKINKIWGLPLFEPLFLCWAKILAVMGREEIQPKQLSPSSSIQGSSPLPASWMSPDVQNHCHRCEQLQNWCLPLGQRGQIEFFMCFLSKSGNSASQSSKSSLPKIMPKACQHKNENTAILSLLCFWAWFSVDLWKILRAAKIAFAKCSKRCFSWLHVPQNTPLCPHFLRTNLS